MKTSTKIALCALLLGIALFIVGTQIYTGSEVHTYEKIYRDSSGYWQGKNVSYLANKVNGLETCGLILAVAGGIGIAFTKE